MTSLGHAHCHLTQNNKLNGTQETLECEWEPVDNVTQNQNGTEETSGLHSL